ncbi:MAG TPA: ROK family protein [Rhizomicrobium sp.]|jgi:polyphosphate glucokinase|nr:ROK family protein [Rhizomicrobium sp.]
MPAARNKQPSAKRILCIDVGGTGLKAAVIGPTGEFLVPRVRVKTPKQRKPADIVPLLVDLVRPLGVFDHVTIGFPGMVKAGKVQSAPAYGTADWAGFPLAAVMRRKLKTPVKLLNDADVQGLAVIKGKGLELVCTLGTGFGTAWFRDGELMPHMDLAHLTLHRKNDFDLLVGDKALKAIGKKSWNKRIKKLVSVLETVFNYDHLYFGGGNSRLVAFKLSRNVTIVDNDAGMEGGAFAWTRHKA